MEQLITILGPTAVGKTDLTLRLAEKLNGIVISGDAYQIYKGLDIGTAKPSREELEAVPHRLIDIRSADESYSAADFQEEARREITKLIQKAICRFCQVVLVFMYNPCWKALIFQWKDRIQAFVNGSMNYGKQRAMKVFWSMPKN